MTNLSICIVNWNTGSFLQECLLSISQFPPSDSYEVIVVDNASIDGSAEIVRQDFPTVKLIANQKNIGYAAGNNLALAAASGEWLLLLNPDVKVNQGTFDRAIEQSLRLLDFGALGITQIGTDGKVQQSVRSFPDPNGVFWELFGFSRFFPNNKYFGSYRMTWFDYRGTIEVDQPMATFLLIRRSVYEAVGGMDEQFPIFFNDVDWSYRIKQLGKRIYYSDCASIFHYGGAGTGQAKRSEMVLESKRSFLKFYEKHYKRKLPSLVYNGICALVRISMLLQRIERR